MNKILTGRKKISEDIVDQDFIKCGYRKIGKYINIKDPIEYICLKHEDKGIQTTRYDNLKTRGRACRYCASETRAEAQRGYSIEQVQGLFSSKGCILLSTEYKNVDTHMDYICENGHIGKVTFYEFKRGCYCTQCRVEMNSGENHWNWNGGVTPENEKARKTNRYKEWREFIFQRDNYTCQCCLTTGVFLNAHHIENFANNKQLRLDVNNGIVLCDSCHRQGNPDSFHTRYGLFNNNREQLIEYITDRRIELGISGKMHLLLL